jgi:putative hemolysin
MGTDLLIILAFLLGNGLFAGAEIAILSVRKTRIREFVRRGDKRAIAIKYLHDHPERFLATVQIMITSCSTAAGAFGGARLAGPLVDILKDAGFGSAATTVALVLVVVGVVFLELVVGELVPKSLALRYASGYSFAVARILVALATIIRPLVWILEGVSNLFLRMVGDQTTFTEAKLSRDELQQLVEEAGKTGSVDPRVGLIAERALDYGEVTLAEVMVPRGRVTALRRDAPVEEVQRIILEEGHSRMPVYDGQIDNIVGYVVARDVLAVAWEKGLILMKDIIRPPFEVQDGSRAIDCLLEMQRTRAQLAIVKDDAGGFAGLVTIEDLLEELVGDIFSEDDVPEPFYTREPGGTSVVLGWASVRKVNRNLDLDLPVGRDRATIAGLCMSLALAIPQAGERLRTSDGTEIEIVEASAQRVRKVRIHPVGGPDPVA